MLNQTTSSCQEPYYTIYVVMSNIVLFTTFPTITLVFVKLLNRLYKTWSFLPAEFILLQMNFTNTFLFIAYLLIFLNVVHGGRFPLTVSLFFYIPSITARPIFLLTLSMISYLAIVHPTTYMMSKAFCHWEWLVTTLGWLYALAMAVSEVIYKIDTSIILFIVLHITILPILFFGITMIRVLCSSGPGNSSQTLNSTKRKAIMLVLSHLVALLVYYTSQVCLFIYRFIAPTDLQRFQCSEGSIILMLPRISDFLIPAISLYSLAKLDV